MMTETTIIMADDHPIFRQGLRHLIEREAGFRVVAEAGDGDATLELIRAESPAVAVLDLDMPGLDGFEVARRARLLSHTVRVVILTMHKDELHFNQAVDAGASGYVVKESAATEIIDCIKAVTRGREYFSPSLSSFLLARSRRAVADRRRRVDPDRAAHTPPALRPQDDQRDRRGTRRQPAHGRQPPRTHLRQARAAGLARPHEVRPPAQGRAVTGTN